MEIILIHLGSNLPDYIWDCIDQIRKYTKEKIIVSLSKKISIPQIFNSNISFVYHDSFDKQGNWKTFDNVTIFKNNDLWRYSCERLFIIEMIMASFNIKRALHIENDNLIYEDPYNITEFHSDKILMTRITPTLISAGILYIGDLKKLAGINCDINNIMSLGIDSIKKKYGNEWLSEMRLLDIIKDTNIEELPILPGKDFVFDCASWGQYVGGTHHNPGISYTTNDHIVGKEINKGNFVVEWVDKKPFVLDIKNNKKTRLFNLHIHSKELNKWM